MSKQKKKTASTAVRSPEPFTLSAVEERFLRLAQAISPYVFILDLSDFKYIFFNRDEFLGYSREEMLSSSAAFRAVHPDDAAAVQTFSQRLGNLPPDETVSIEYQLKNKAGEWEWVRHQTSGLRYGDDGRPTQLLILLDPFTEKRQKEQALRQSEERFRALAANLPGMAYRCRNEPDWPMEFVSEGSRQLTGYLPHELVAGGTAVYGDLIHEEDQKRVWETVQAGIAANESFEVTYRIQDRDGREKWVWEQGQGAYDADNELIALEGFVTDISERVKMENETRFAMEQRRRQVGISTQIAQEITAITNLDQLYQDAVTLVKEQFGYYHVQLLRYDLTADAVVLITGYGDIGQKMLAAGHKMPMGRGLVGTAAATGRAMLSANISEDPNWQPNPLLPHTRGELAVPIKFGQELLGVLDVQSDRPNSLNEEDLVMLEGLCGQIAVAIESARLRQNMAQQLDELNKLQRFFTQEGWQTYQAVESAPGFQFDRSQVNVLSEALLQEWLGDGRETAVNGESPPAHITPLAVRGAAIGLLGLENDPARPLSPEDEALLGSIAGQISEALETARLLEQTQKRAVELETVARVSAAASTILDTEKLLKTVVNLTQSRFNLYHAAIFLLEEGETGTTLRMAAASGEKGDEMVAEKVVISLMQEQSLIARAARAREPVMVNDTSQDAGFLPHPLVPDARSELALPMLVGDRLVGVLGVQSDRINQFTIDDVRIQTTLAAQVAIALQNANLYAEQLATAAKLREVDRLKSEFLASMSHELRTPLNSIIGFADVMLEGIDGPLNERMTEDVTFIRDSGRHLRELIGEILDMSKIEAGMMELRYNKIDPKRLAKDVMSTSAALLQNREVELRLELDPDIEIIQADEMRLRQIFYNLMSNAIKFTEQGHVTLKVKTTADELVVSVEDTGIGIRAEDIPIVFEQFRQVDGSLTRKVGGSGLGMPISKSLVELHGGRMGVDSTPGKGSNFWFTIPKTEPAAAAKGDTGPLRPGTGPLRLGPPK